MLKRFWDWITKPFRKPGNRQDLGGPGPFHP